MVGQKSENLGLSSLHFRRVNSYIEEVFHAKKNSRRRFYGSKNKLERQNSVNPGSKNSAIPKSTEKSKQETPFDNVCLTDKICNIEEANIMPFLLNFNQSLLAKSIVITTKEYGNQYML